MLLRLRLRWPGGCRLPLLLHLLLLWLPGCYRRSRSWRWRRCCWGWRILLWSIIVSEELAHRWRLRRIWCGRTKHWRAHQRVLSIRRLWGERWLLRLLWLRRRELLHRRLAPLRIWRLNRLKSSMLLLLLLLPHLRSKLILNVCTLTLFRLSCQYCQFELLLLFYLCLFLFQDGIDHLDLVFRLIMQKRCSP